MRGDLFEIYFFHAIVALYARAGQLVDTLSNIYEFLQIF